MNKPDSPAVAVPDAPARNLAPPVEPATLPARVLQERRLIHAEPSGRRLADAFREIRTRLLGVAGRGNLVTLVCAVSPRSGGSFVARNLALAFALPESRSALLIDCNLRHPDQHCALEVDPSRGGLLDYLEHPSLGLENVLYRTGIPRLRLIPTGSRRELAGEYFSSFRMRALLDSLRSRYPDRNLFLDGPAVRGAPEVRTLGELADAIILVVGHGRDTPAAIQRALSKFDPDKLAGVVLNELP